ncbi:hypothetical protein A2U01_0019501 [Trifolium medium]|uniref:Uncharacterized protein n=1 Tax=Trifolium medium TaxID=97028 RepID=A0A392NH06_9FABA|nr:hypothetical protein [Trifolium medium]
MALENVRDEIAHGEITTESLPILEKVADLDMDNQGHDIENIIADDNIQENTRAKNQTRVDGTVTARRMITILVGPVQECVLETQLELKVTGQPTVHNVFRDTQGRALPLVAQRDMQITRQA